MTLFNPELDTPATHSRWKGQTLRDRFIAKLDRQDANGCLLWAGSIDGGGRGHIWSGEKLVKAPRLAYFIEHGPFDDSLVVRHKCDVRKCVNPDHLELGTQADNIRDMHERGRAAPSKGEANGRALLSEAQVLDIYERAHNGERVKDLAIEFGVTRMTVSQIKNGRNWAWLTGHNSPA